MKHNMIFNNPTVSRIIMSTFDICIMPKSTIDFGSVGIPFDVIKGSGDFRFCIDKGILQPGKYVPELESVKKPK